MTWALHTDHYELTMLDVALESGIAENRAVFEVFARSLPGGRRYGVVAGTGRLVEAVRDFRFETEEIAWMQRSGLIGTRTARWLEGRSFGGDIEGYEEGEVYFPGSPVLTVSGSLGEAIILETLVLSMLNFDSGVATAAARIKSAAGDRQLLEMGTRRVHEQAAVAAARAAYIGGFGATSNLATGFRYGVPTAGTSAHSFTLAYPSEEAAFVAQVSVLGPSTTLLVDTFDVASGIAAALAAAGKELGAIRIDSGDLGKLATDARRELDASGAGRTRIILSGDLDAVRIAGLVAEGVPVDGFGVGTAVVSGPPPGFVYKLVEIADMPGEEARMRPVAKRGGVKATVGGRKRAWRSYGADGRAVAELVLGGAHPRGESPVRPLQVSWIGGGETVRAPDLDHARSRCRGSLDELPERAFVLEPGEPCIPTIRDSTEPEEPD